MFFQIKKSSSLFQLNCQKEVLTEIYWLVFDFYSPNAPMKRTFVFHLFKELKRNSKWLCFCVEKSAKFVYKMANKDWKWLTCTYYWKGIFILDCCRNCLPLSETFDNYGDRRFDLHYFSCGNEWQQNTSK